MNLQPCISSAPPLSTRRLAFVVRSFMVLSLTALTASAANAQGLGMENFDFGARVQLDHSAFSGVTTRDGSTTTASYVRRAEATVRLRVNPQWRAAATAAYEDDDLVLDTAAVSWQPLGGLELRVGRINPDFGLDNANSSSWTAGIERSAIWDLAPGIADATEGYGARADGHGSGWHASAGFYDKRDRKSFVARGAWMHAGAGEDVFQLGASVARSGSMDDNGRVRTRLGLRGVTEEPAGRRSDLAPRVRLPGRYIGETVLGVEAALQRGPWLLQAEALTRRLEDEAGAPSRSVSGQTLQVAWSPSGEARAHDASDASFGRPTGDGREFGRWELFYRYDTMSGVEGLTAQVHTLGASWFLGRTWRVSANVVANRSDDPNSVGDRSGSGWVLRGQAVF
jgi:phosphate-selective porin OprO and OprP